MSVNYGETAANWWCEKIKEGNFGCSPKNIDKFRDSLSSEINRIFSLDAHLSITTYNSPSQLLNSIATLTGMNATIPKGYEMTIFPISGVLVYNEVGRLVASF